VKDNLDEKPGNKRKLVAETGPPSPFALLVDLMARPALP